MTCSLSSTLSLSNGCSDTCSLIHTLGPEGELGSLTALDETTNSVLLTWLRPPDSTLNDDSGNFLYRIRWETNESRAGEQQSGLFDHYPPPRSSTQHWDEYQVTGLIPYAYYDLCVVLATFPPSFGLLEGEQNCTRAQTNSSGTWCVSTTCLGWSVKALSL